MTEATQKREEWSDTGGHQLERRQTGAGKVRSPAWDGHKEDKNNGN